MGTITCELESSYAATAGDDKAAKLDGKLGDSIPQEPPRRRITFAGDGGKGKGRRLGDGGGTPTAWSLLSLRRRRRTSAGSGGMQVFVRTLAGRTLALDVSPDDTVDAVKARIQAKERVAAADQRLVFAGRDLDDGRRTLAECGVAKEANLYLQLRLRGGAGGEGTACGLTVAGVLAIVVAVGAALAYFPTSSAAATGGYGGLALLFVWGLALVGVNLITAGVCRLTGASAETLCRAARSALSMAAAFARQNVAVLGPAAASSAATGIIFSGADPVLSFVCFALFLSAMSLTLFLVFAGRRGGTEVNLNLRLLPGGTRGTATATAGPTAAVGLLVASAAVGTALNCFPAGGGAADTGGRVLVLLFLMWSVAMAGVNLIVAAVATAAFADE